MAEPKRYWLDDKRNVRKIIAALITTCALLTVADLFYHKYVHVAAEKIPGFHGAYGFVGAVFLVMAAKWSRKILMRGERYYDD